MFARFSNMFGNNDEGSNMPSSSKSQSGNSTPHHFSNDQQYKIDNSSSILDKISSLYTKRIMSDIILVVGKQEYHAHRLILCSSSDVFEVMLMNPQWSESHEPRIILQEAPECIDIFEMFLKYMYTGKLQVTHGSVLPVLALADKYNVKDLIHTCCAYMNEHIVSATKQNYLISWLQYTLACGHSVIAESCMNQLKWNFESVAQTKDFAGCDVTLLTRVLSQDDIVVHDELTLYNFIVSWLRYQEELLLFYTPAPTPGEPPTQMAIGDDVSHYSLSINDQSSLILSQSSSSISLNTLPMSRNLDDRSRSNSPCSTLFNSVIPRHPSSLFSSKSSSSHSQPSINPSRTKLVFLKGTTSNSADPLDQMEYLTYEVMRFIRFPMMTPRQLADLLLDTLTIKYKEFFVTRMAIGMSFHSGQWNRIKEVLNDPDPSNQLLFSPRLYTAEKWSAGLTVDNLPGLPAYHTRTLVFSTPASASELENDSQLEWIVELYPKGVWFRKCFLIVYHGTVEIPEAVLRTVRLAITAKDAEYARVRISILVYGIEDGIEYITNVVSMRHIFTADDNLLNIDDVLSFDLLNHAVDGQKYLLDPCSALRIHVVINPLFDPKLSGKLGL